MKEEDVIDEKEEFEMEPLWQLVVGESDMISLDEISPEEVDAMAEEMAEEGVVSGKGGKEEESMPQEEPMEAFLNRTGEQQAAEFVAEFPLELQSPAPAMLDLEFDIRGDDFMTPPASPARERGLSPQGRQLHTPRSLFNTPSVVRRVRTPRRDFDGPPGATRRLFGTPEGPGAEGSPRVVEIPTDDEDEDEEAPSIEDSPPEIIIDGRLDEEDNAPVTPIAIVSAAPRSERRPGQRLADGTISGSLYAIADMLLKPPYEKELMDRVLRGQSRELPTFERLEKVWESLIDYKYPGYEDASRFKLFLGDLVYVVTMYADYEITVREREDLLRQKKFRLPDTGPEDAAIESYLGVVARVKPLITVLLSDDGKAPPIADWFWMITDIASREFDKDEKQRYIPEDLKMRLVALSRENKRRHLARKAERKRLRAAERRRRAGAKRLADREAEKRRRAAGDSDSKAEDVSSAMMICTRCGTLSMGK